MARSIFLSSSTLAQAEEVRVGGVSPVETFRELQQEIRRHASREAAQLFCEPVISASNGAAPTSISWYTEFEGAPAPLTSLDAIARPAAEALLRARIEALAPAIAASPKGQEIAASLYVRSLDDIYLVGGQPVITNWGIVPEDTTGSEAALHRHFRDTLGSVGVHMSPPPLEPESWEDWRDNLDVALRPRGAVRSGAAAGLAAAGVAGAPGSAAASQSAGDQGAAAAPSTPPPPPPTGAGDYGQAGPEPWYRRAWAPALMATIVAAVILLVLLIPGVLLYPAVGNIATLEEDVALRRASNAALEERLERLRQAQAENQCTAEGDFIGPDGLTIEGTMPPPLPPGGAAAPAERESSAASLLPPGADRLQVTPPGADGAGEAERHSLLDLLDQTTVLILAPGQGDQGQGFGIGTGFFVNADTIVTNRHVVEDAAPGRLFVTSRALGAVRNARIDAVSADTGPGGDDFALLRGDFGGSGSFLSLAGSVDRLENVVAAGYPALISTMDSNFQRLVQEGDATAAPSLATTRGVVTVVQSFGDGGEVIAHDADISPGNSGGPLVDLCGRVVGVNTFTNLDRQTAARARYSLHVSRLRGFLNANGVAFTMAEGPCRPQVASTAQTPEASGDAEASTEGAEAAETVQ